MKYLSVILLTIIILAVAVPSFAFIAERKAEAVQVAIVRDSGSPLPGIPYRMSRTAGTAVIRSFLEARKGDHYGIVVRNLTASRIGVVIAVDGRNIISGQKSDLTSREEMYVLAPYESAQLDGWRTAQDTVHRFYFTEPSDSYSMQTFHDSSAMGVIAVAAFREKQPVRILRERAKKEQMPGSPGPAESMNKSRSESAFDSAGTGFGDAQYSPTTRVAFTPEAIPFQKNLIKYEWRQTLCRKGLINCASEPRNRLWDEERYAPFPPTHSGR